MAATRFALRDLQVVSDQAAPQRHPDYETNFSLHTIASPVAGAPALIVVRDNRRRRT
jgi:hypothetical protein